MDGLFQAVSAIRAATQWEGIENIEAARQTCQRVRSLPPLEAEIDPALLSLTLEPSSAHALSRWAELVLSALQLEALIDEMCERERLSSHLNDVRDLVERPEALGVQDATLA